MLQVGQRGLGHKGGGDVLRFTVPLKLFKLARLIVETAEDPS
jgi:hypothetical protein